MKTLINGYDMFAALGKFSDEQIRMIFNNQKDALIIGADDQLFDDQKITISDTDDSVTLELEHAGKKAYVYLNLADQFDVSNYKYQVVMDCREMGIVPLYVTNDRQLAEEIVKASIKFAEKTADNEEYVEIIRNSYSVRKAA